MRGSVCRTIRCTARMRGSAIAALVHSDVMAGRLPSALRFAAAAFADVTPEGIATSPVCEMLWNDPPMLFQAPQPVQVIVAGLLLFVNPQSDLCPPLPLLSKPKQFDIVCAAETLLPPILKPLPLLWEREV